MGGGRGAGLGDLGVGASEVPSGHVANSKLGWRKANKRPGCVGPAKVAPSFRSMSAPRSPKFGPKERSNGGCGMGWKQSASSNEGTIKTSRPHKESAGSGAAHMHGCLRPASENDEVCTSVFLSTDLYMTFIGDNMHTSAQDVSMASPRCFKRPTLKFAPCCNASRSRLVKLLRIKQHPWGQQA